MSLFLSTTEGARAAAVPDAAWIVSKAEQALAQKNAETEKVRGVGCFRRRYLAAAAVAARALPLRDPFPPLWSADGRAGRARGATHCVSAPWRRDE